MKTLAQWLAQLEASQPRHFRLGLERIARVITQLELVPTAPVISVAGTNGKGSTCAYLEAILTAAGFRPLCSYSPHLLDFTERVRFNSAPVSATNLVEQFEIIAAADAQRPQGSEALSYFEYVTVASVLAGNAARCGVFILEVGLGGRLDAVNAYDADVAVITSIGIDHVEHLGADREAIASEKAGIMRPQKPLVLGARDPPASLLAQVAASEVPLVALGDAFDYEYDRTSWTYRGSSVRGALPRPLMPGLHQLANAACAVAVLEQLSVPLPVNQAEIRAGLLEAKLRGRFEVLPGQPPVVLDVAHNGAAAKVLAAALLDMGYFPATHFVFGVRANKDCAAIVAELERHAAGWHIAPLVHDQRGDGVPQLRDALATARASVQEYPSIAAATQGALAAGADRIVVGGSFLTVEEYLRMHNGSAPQKRRGS